MQKTSHPAGRTALRVGLALSLVASTVVSAHHSFAMFDRDKTMTLKGTVKEFQWTNPHVFIQLMVKTEQGATVEWSIEGASPNMLLRRGWSRQSFKPGEVVSVVVNPMRDETKHGANFVQATFADGKTLGEMGSRAPG